jgi:hypothetical protein
MPITRAVQLLDRGFPLFVGPRLPVLASLEGLVTWMLQPRRPRPRQDIDVEPVDAADLDAELRRYPPEVRAAATEFLNGDGGEIRLSEVLSRARASGASNAVLEVMALLVLQGFSTEDRDTAHVAAEPIAGAQLEDPLLYGDDLLVSAARRSA